VPSFGIKNGLSQQDPIKKSLLQWRPFSVCLILVWATSSVVFWFGKSSLFSNNHDVRFLLDSRDEQGRAGANLFVLFRDFRSGLGIWSEGNVRLFDVPLLVASARSGWTEEWIYVGLWAPIIFVSGVLLARVFGCSRSASSWSGVFLLYAILLPSPFLWSRISIQGLYFTQVALAGLLLSLLVWLSVGRGGGGSGRWLRVVGLVMVVVWANGLYGAFSVVLLQAVLLWLVSFVLASWLMKRSFSVWPWFLTLLMLLFAVVFLAIWLLPSLSLGQSEVVDAPVQTSFSFPFLRFTNMSFLGVYGNHFAVVSILVLSASGIGVSWRQRNRLYALFAILVSAGYAMFAVVHQAVGVFLGIEFGPRPLYLEDAAWIPVMMPGLGTLVVSVGSSILRGVDRKFRVARGLATRIAPFGAVVVLLMWAVVWIGDNHDLRKGKRYYPIESSDLTAGVLSTLADTTKFQGRVMIIEPPSESSSPLQMGSTSRPLFEELRMKRIPTLQTYSHLISDRFGQAAYEWFYDGSRVQRNQVTFKSFDRGIAGLLGVRYVIALCDTDGVGDLPIVERVNLFCVRELSRVNVGDFSPTRIVLEQELEDPLSYMASEGFDALQDVVTDQELEGLAPVVAAGFSAESGQVIVDVTTTGKSLIVLPVEYSSCMSVSSVAGPVKLLRVNYLLTGLVVSATGRYTIDVKRNLYTFNTCF
jgi:hypothetical protein